MDFCFSEDQETIRELARQILEAWDLPHDSPDAEEHILQVGSEATTITLRKMAYVIVDLDNEEVFNYPFIYFSSDLNFGQHIIDLGLCGANFKHRINQTRGTYNLIHYLT